MSDLWAIGLLLATFGALMLASVFFNRAIERLGIPVLLIFLALGMVAQGIGNIQFNDFHLSFRIGTVALILILLDGGFNTPLRDIKHAIVPASLLATVGVAITALLVAWFACWLGMDRGLAALLGATVSSTDAAAVFSVLRGGGVGLKKRLETALELESGLNDPTAVVLTLTVTQFLLHEDTSASHIAIAIPLQLIGGLLIGVGVGFAGSTTLRRIRLSTGGMYPIITLALTFLSFGTATVADCSGFLAVYACAVFLGNSQVPFRSGLVRVHDALAWLSQLGMFITLGLLVTLSELPKAAPVGLSVALFLAFVARPLASAVCLAPLRYRWREVVFTGWVGLRGAVPIILAIFPVLDGVPGAQRIFHIVFFVVVVNAIIPGVSIRHMVRWLRLEEPLAAPPPLAALEINSTRLLSGEIMSFYVTPAIAVSGATLAEIPFPSCSAAILIVRNEELVAARGTTQLKPGDHVYIFSRPEDKPFIELLFGRPSGE